MTGKIAELEKPDLSSRDRLSPISSRELFGDAKEIEIDHEGALYRLRITRQGKLILNK